MELNNIEAFLLYSYVYYNYYDFIYLFRKFFLNNQKRRNVYRRTPLTRKRNVRKEMTK